MRHDPIDRNLFIANRKALAARLKPFSLAILNSNDIWPSSADGTFSFKQHSDIYYLTGISQEETVLMLCPDAKAEKYREVLFLRETNEHIAVWEGHKFTKEEAREVSGIETVLWLSELHKVLEMCTFQSEYVYLNTNEHLRANLGRAVQTRDDRFAEDFRKSFPLHKYERLNPHMHALRIYKSQPEIDTIRKACEITRDGFLRLLKFVKPGVTEYEVEAEMIHEYTRKRSRGYAYEPIIASGKSACILHYVENKRECKAGEVLLLDAAAEYAGYASDLTRSIPVSGRFTERQRAVYDAVLRVQKEAYQMLVPGNTWQKYHAEIELVMQSELLGLGLLTKQQIADQNPDWPAYKKYFPHNTSHHIGLDVHDYGDVWQPFDVGMVLTVEPGIYIPEEGLGIRLENNVVITENGINDLMFDIPIEAEEIEELMNS